MRDAFAAGPIAPGSADAQNPIVESDFDVGWFDPR